MHNSDHSELHEMHQKKSDYCVQTQTKVLQVRQYREWWTLKELDEQSKQNPEPFKSWQIWQVQQLHLSWSRKEERKCLCRWRWGGGRLMSCLSAGTGEAIKVIKLKSSVKVWIGGEGRRMEQNVCRLRKQCETIIMQEKEPSLSGFQLLYNVEELVYKNRYKIMNEKSEIQVRRYQSNEKIITIINLNFLNTINMIKSREK